MYDDDDDDDEIDHDTTDARTAEKKEGEGEGEGKGLERFTERNTNNHNSSDKNVEYELKGKKRDKIMRNLMSVKRSPSTIENMETHHTNLEQWGTKKTYKVDKRDSGGDRSVVKGSKLKAFQDVTIRNDAVKSHGVSESAKQRDVEREVEEENRREKEKVTEGDRERGKVTESERNRKKEKGSKNEREKIKNCGDDEKEREGGKRRGREEMTPTLPVTVTYKDVRVFIGPPKVRTIEHNRREDVQNVHANKEGSSKLDGNIDINIDINKRKSIYWDGESNVVRSSSKDKIHYVCNGKKTGGRNVESSDSSIHRTDKTDNKVGDSDRNFNNGDENNVDDENLVVVSSRMRDENRVDETGVILSDVKCSDTAVHNNNNNPASSPHSHPDPHPDPHPFTRSFSPNTPHDKRCQEKAMKYSPKYQNMDVNPKSQTQRLSQLSNKANRFLYSCPSFYSYPSHSLPVTTVHTDSVTFTGAVSNFDDVNFDVGNICGVDKSVFDGVPHSATGTNILTTNTATTPATRNTNNDIKEINAHDNNNNNSDKKAADYDCNNAHEITGTKSSTFDIHETSNAPLHVHSVNTDNRHIESVFEESVFEESVFEESVETDFLVATAYDESLGKIFGHISALEVCISQTRKRELEKVKKRINDAEDKSNQKYSVESREEFLKGINGVKFQDKNNHLNDRRRNRGDVIRGSEKNANESTEFFKENTENDRLFRTLPTYDYSNAVFRIIKSLLLSAEKKEEFLFVFRVNSLVDENGFSLAGGRGVLSLQDISPTK